MPATTSSFRQRCGVWGVLAILLALAVIVTVTQQAQADGDEGLSAHTLVTPGVHLTAVVQTLVPFRTATPTPTRRFQLTAVPYRTATPTPTRRFELTAVPYRTATPDIHITPEFVTPIAP